MRFGQFVLVAGGGRGGLGWPRWCSPPVPVLVGVVGQRERRGTGGLVFLRSSKPMPSVKAAVAVLPGTVHDDGVMSSRDRLCRDSRIPLHQVETHFATAFQVGVAAVVGGDSERPRRRTASVTSSTTSWVAMLRITLLAREVSMWERQ